MCVLTERSLAEAAHSGDPMEPLPTAQIENIHESFDVVNQWPVGGEGRPASPADRGSRSSGRAESEATYEQPDAPDAQAGPK